ncbi:MAG: MaoC domain protein dehydratase [Pseudonocardiales bacterium]|nr:MaoC domain protein dehydratase [Pseudonocardiales bacterium]
MTLTEVITKFWTDSPDHPVVVGKAVSIETHPPTAHPPTAQAPTAHPSTAHPPTAQAPAKPSGDSPSAPPVATAGSELDVALDPFVDRALTVTDFVKYQGASGDFNAIHHDTDFALNSGLPGPLAIGMLPAGIASAYVTDRFGAESVRRFRVRWQNQAWPGDVLTYQGFELGDPSSDFDLRLSVTRPDGGVHLQAWVELDPKFSTRER